MAIEKAKELLKTIRTAPNSKELLKDAAEPRSEEDMIRLCAQIAPKPGFDVTEKEIRDAITAAAQERREKTAADIEKLTDDEMEKATGGAEDKLWQGEDAPDGHEMGCLITYHGWYWSRDNDTWCRENYWCYKSNEILNYYCSRQDYGCSGELRK